MIDIHTHILPSVDDGSPNLNTSIELIKSEINEGVTDIFVTPHYFKYRGYFSTAEENQRYFEGLKKEVFDLGLKVNLYLGNEIFYNRLTIRNLEHGIVRTLGETKYVLIEFSTTDETEDIPEAVNNLTAKGYIPIIAHPERYSYLSKIEEYQYLRKMGAMIQINAGTIIGNSGRKIKKFIFKLIKNNLVDFVASDIHSFRPGLLKEAYKIITKEFSIDIAEKIFNNKLIFE